MTLTKKEAAWQAYYRYNLLSNKIDKNKNMLIFDIEPDNSVIMAEGQ